MHLCIYVWGETGKKSLEIDQTLGNVSTAKKNENHCCREKCKTRAGKSKTKEKYIQNKKGKTQILYLALLDIFLRNSSLIFQFATFPFTKPATITKRRTRTLIAVKILFTQADSFTPKDKRPMEKRKGILIFFLPKF